MATERLLMRTTRETLRLKWLLQRSHRETARSLDIPSACVLPPEGTHGTMHALGIVAGS
jgi:hypothetical protein